MAVHSLTCDSPDVTNVTKFLGHSAPVLDVCWNYDETLMASCDTKVRVSVLRAWITTTKLECVVQHRDLLWVVFHNYWGGYRILEWRFEIRVAEGGRL